MNILLFLFADTIASFVINNKVGIVEHNIVPTHPDPPTLAGDLTLDAPASVPQIAVDPDGLLVEHFLTVLIAHGLGCDWNQYRAWDGDPKTPSGHFRQ